MLRFQIAPDNSVLAIADSFNQSQITDGNWVCRHDIQTLALADDIASAATKFSGKLHIAIDNGEWVSPRYDVIEAPQVGENVSYAFNGDYYPCGQITKISSTLKQITTSTGRTFHRRKLSGRWVSQGTWTMVHGHISKLNPEF